MTRNRLGRNNEIGNLALHQLYCKLCPSIEHCSITSFDRLDIQLSAAYDAMQLFIHESLAMCHYEHRSVISSRAQSIQLLRYCRALLVARKTQSETIAVMPSWSAPASDLSMHPWPFAVNRSTATVFVPKRIGSAVLATSSCSLCSCAICTCARSDIGDGWPCQRPHAKGYENKNCTRAA